MSDTPTRVTEALVRTAKVYLRLSAPGLAGLGLQLGQDVLLRQLWRSDGMPQAELVACLSVEPPTVTKMLGRLEKTGFVKRRRNPKIPRQWLVFLTPKGKKVERAVRDHWAGLEARATQGFSLEEKATFIALAVRVRQNLCGPVARDQL